MVFQQGGLSKEVSCMCVLYASVTSKAGLIHRMVLYHAGGLTKGATVSGICSLIVQRYLHSKHMHALNCVYTPTNYDCQ